MRKESVAFVTQDGTVDNTAHVAAFGDFRGRYVNLQNVAFSVVDGSAVDDTIQL